jgi:UTP--glucose-1-phosphate uridylyltransferase
LITKAVIPTAGLGTRFHPVTKIIPKELLPVLNTPALEIIIQEAINSGIEEIIIVNSSSKPLINIFIENYLKNLNPSIAKNVDISIIIQEKPLGLGHAILQSYNKIQNDPFAVLLPDDIIFSKVPLLRQMINKYSELQSSMLCVKSNPNHLLRHYGVIEPSRKENATNIDYIIEKPNIDEAPSDLCVVGRYIFTSDIFNQLSHAKPTKNNEIQLTDSINNLIQLQSVHQFLLAEPHFDIGTPMGLISASLYRSQNDQTTI